MKTVIVSLLIAGLFSYPNLVNAQADPDTYDGGGNSLGSGHMPRDNYDQGGEKSLDLDIDNRNPTEVPFDGGASLLLIAGAAYGAKKAAARAKRKKLNADK